MSIRILHIDNSPAVTGAYKALLSWCLDTPAFDHIWVLPEGSEVAPAVTRHLTMHQLPFVEIGRSPKKLLGYLPALLRNGRRLAKIIDREQIDVLHANDLYNLTPYAARLFSRRKPPLLVHARMLRRSFPGRIYDFWVRWHLRKADAVVAVSEAIKKDWGGADRVAVIYDPIEVREELPPYRFDDPAGRTFRFLYLANYIQGKGQEDALQAIKLLREQGVQNFRVDFHGGTMGLAKNEAFKASLQEFITAQGLGAHAVLHGPTDTVERLMKDHDALLHLSHAESFGMVCYEGLYYGLPVISTDCGGPAEMMAPGVSGVLLPVADTAGIGAAMRHFIERPGYCAALSAAARRVIRERFRPTAELSDLFARLGERQPAEPAD